MALSSTTRNLLSRTDKTKGTSPYTATSETFGYNYNLDQLKTITQNGSIDSIMYSTNGNISKKSKVGNYNYGTKINAVTGINAPCGSPNPLDSFINTDIQYTPFNKPDTIRLRDLKYSFMYGPDHQRTKTIFKKNGVTMATRYYVGNYEKFIDSAGAVKHIYYIGGNTIAVKENGSIKFYYVYTDHLGSILKVTDSTGSTVGEQSFDAWGRERNYNDWSKDTITQATTSPFASLSNSGWLNRGYTGHEHLSQFNIINMNGRLYDPIVGRMLSPDNYNLDATYTQAYNRYSYVTNNPLKYIDPSGWKYAAASANVRRSIPEFMENYNPGGAGSTLGKGNWSSVFMQVASQYGTFAAMNASNNGTISDILTYGVMNSVKVYELSFEDRKGTYHKFGKTNVGNSGEQGKYDYGWQVREHIEFGIPDLSEFMNNATAGGGNMADYVPDIKKAPRQNYSGVWGKIKYVLTGGNSGGYQYDWNGKAMGLTPMMGMPPPISLGPLGLGNTGRVVANNLVEQMTMNRVMEDPTIGKIIINSLKDPRWYGWSKMQYVVESNNGVKVVIHYAAKWVNGAIVAVDDFKFMH